MGLSCLAYIAQLDPNMTANLLSQQKDSDTREYAQKHITGVRVLACGHVFEIMEGDYGTLESMFDRLSSSSFVREPELLLFNAMPKPQFQSWKMGTLQDAQEPKCDLEVFHTLAKFAQADPGALPATALKMLQQFNDQFVKKSPQANAA